jgi:putative RNA 2'-phosphotransferase
MFARLSLEKPAVPSWQHDNATACCLPGARNEQLALQAGNCRRSTRFPVFLIITVSLLVLRHKPESIGICMDERGWTSVAYLLAGCHSAGVSLTLAELRELVESSDKQRFAFSADRLKIRANQGHSVPVDLGYQPEKPPEVLFHRTGEKSVAAIHVQGLHRQKRHHVHLSATHEQAEKVGRRHGIPDGSV